MAYLFSLFAQFCVLISIFAQFWATSQARVFKHRGQTFARARVAVRAELSARTKSEEKCTTGHLHETLEKRVHQKTQGRYSEIPYVIFPGIFLFFVGFFQSALSIQFAISFPRFSVI